MKFPVLLMFLGTVYMCFAKEEIKCGTKGKGIGRIVGGKTVKTAGLWPWQISIKTKRGGHFCGGSIIKPNWIVTAAHCFQQNAKPGHYQITAGELNLKKDEGDEQVKDIEKIIRHPKYNEKGGEHKYDYDITLLKLKSNIEYNDKVRPVCLPKKRFQDGTKCTVTGWGYLTYKPTTSPDYLQQLEVPLVSDEECKKSFPKATSRMICAGYTKKGKGSCMGDSGGPLVCKNKSGVWDLAGIVSFGKPCALKNFVDAYANVDDLKEWVEGHINKKD